MLPWKVLLGIVAGAVLVKEWKRADRLYESARVKLSTAAKKLKESWQAEANNGNTEPEQPTAV